jgi:branched-subunit amino acid ABC-type transport system permease component
MIGNASSLQQRVLRALLITLPLLYGVMFFGQPAGFDIPKIVDIIRNDPSVIIQQLINGLANGAIIAIIALGYTMVYGIIELVNFANGDVYMLGAMTALFALSPFIIFNPETGGQSAPWWAALLGFIPAMLVGALLNYSAERIAYRRLRNSPKIVALISAIGMSFILQNIGLQIASFGKLALLKDEYPALRVFEVFGENNAAPKSFPSVFSNDNLIDYVFPPPQPTKAAVKPAGPKQVAVLQDATPTLEPTATLDPTQAAEETAIIGTLEAEQGGTSTPDPSVATPEPPAEEAPTPEDQPTLDPTAAAEETAIIATLEAEQGGTSTPEPPAPVDGADPNAPPGGEVTPGDAPFEPAPVEEPPPTNKIRFTFKDLLVITVAVILMGALNWFVQNTRTGKAMRATAQNRAAAQIMGINIDTVISLTFIIGGALAGAAGMMSGLYYGTATFTMGFTAGLRSFTAAVFGGIGNIRGAALGGILIGIIAAFSDQFFSVRWTNAWVFLILVLVLIFKPTGLLGSDGGEKA